MQEVYDYQPLINQRSKSSVISLDKKRGSKDQKKGKKTEIQMDVKNCVEKLSKSLERVGQ